MMQAYCYQTGRTVEAVTDPRRFREHVAGGTGLLWVDIQSPDDADIECLLECFGLHPLTVEDCILPNSRPKLELFEQYAFLVAHGIGHDTEDGQRLTAREVDVCLGANFLITVHGEPLECIAKDLSRVERHSPIMMRQPDFLLHAVLDSLLDTFFPIIDEVNERVDVLEQELLDAPRDSHVNDILALQSQVIKLRRILTPQRDVIAQLHRGDVPFITAANQVYFRDLFDRLLRMSDLVDSCREITTTMLEAQAMISNNRVNDSVRVLTAFATIMGPAAIISSIYGMNFRHQPEFAWRWGYPFALGLMLLTSGGLFLYFKRQKWL